MCQKTSSHKFNHAQHQEDWERAKERFNEFSQKFNARVNEAFAEKRKNGEASEHKISLSLPSGRQFSFSIGHIVLLVLALIVLPTNLVLLGGLLLLAYMFGNGGTSGEEKPKRKIKTDEKPEDFEVFRV